MSRLLSYKKTGEALGDLSESTVRRLVKEGKLAPPVVVSVKSTGAPARVAFIEAEVLAYAEQIIARGRGVGSSIDPLLTRG